MSEHKVAIITGTNSNLGLNVAYRLLESIPKECRVTIVVTSRTLPRAKECIDAIKAYNVEKVKRIGILDFDYLLVDFTNMVSILTAYYDLNKQHKKIDYLFINAAQGVYDGIDWVQATRDVICNPIQAVTNPTYKLQRTGVKSKDGMGLVFQANVFGPYYFIEKIKPLLERSEDPRIIWISSLMSDPKYLSFNDIELLQSGSSYEGSKRLVDLLHLASYETLLKENGIKQYLVHPGIFISLSFMKFLNVFTYYGMLWLFYLARYLGSPWHNITGYNAANAVLFALKADPKEDSQQVKYGSACGRKGRPYLVRGEVDPTGKHDVLKYVEDLRDEWNARLKDQIVDTRRLD